jgi:putative RecB family exonuclease
MVKHHSYTRLNDFEACPRRFRLKHLDKVPEPPSEPLMIGRIIHDVAARYALHCLEAKVQTDVTAISPMAREEFYKQPALPSERLPEIVSLVERLAESYVVDLEHTVGVEEQVKIFFNHGQQIFWGYIDRLMMDGTVATLVDLKTDHNLRSQSDVDNDLQLRVYAWAVKQMYPQVTEVRSSLYFVRHQVLREGKPILAEEIPAIEASIMAGIARIDREEKFDPTPGSACGWCTYAADCPAALAVKASGKVAVTTPEDAQKVAAELALLERQVADRKDALKRYVTVAGPVYVNGLAWGFWPVDSVGVKDGQLEMFLESCEGLGYQRDDLLRVDAYALKRVLADEQVRAVLDPYLVDKSYTRFDSKKLKEGNAA